MSVTTAGRVTRRTVCPLHFVEFGQVYDPGVPGQREATWLPPRCLQCEVELRDQILADEELSRQTEEIEAETDRRCAADLERAARIEEATNRSMAEEAAKLLAEFYALHREEWRAYENDQDWHRIAAEVKEEKRAEFFEQLRKER